MTPSTVCIGILLMACYPVHDGRMSASEGATFCQVYQPIRWSPKDSRLTKEQVDTMNRIWVQLCSKK